MKINFIAEFCQNHLGSRKILREMIYKAVYSGASYGKIQSIRTKNLTFRKRFEKDFIIKNKLSINPRPYKEEYDRLKKLELSIDDEKWFVRECIKAGLKPMTTVFDKSTVDEIKDIGFEAIKIASYDCASFPLLKLVKKNWPLLIVSTGATFDNEVIKASNILKNHNFIFLHCVTIYPTPLEDLNLIRMNWLKKFTNDIGFSDHTSPSKSGLLASKLAITFGANWIERHFTVLDKTKTRDGPVSVNEKELKDIINFSELSSEKRLKVLKNYKKDFDKYLGNHNRDLTKLELHNRDYYRGRFASKINGKISFNWNN
jgi:sialic acid synthase SpsE